MQERLTKVVYKHIQNILLVEITGVIVLLSWSKVQLSRGHSFLFPASTETKQQTTFKLKLLVVQTFPGILTNNRNSCELYSTGNTCTLEKRVRANSVY